MGFNSGFKGLILFVPDQSLNCGKSETWNSLAWTMKVPVFWHVTSCSLMEMYLHFR